MVDRAFLFLSRRIVHLFTITLVAVFVAISIIVQHHNNESKVDGDSEIKCDQFGFKVAGASATVVRKSLDCPTQTRTGKYSTLGFIARINNQQTQAD